MAKDFKDILMDQFNKEFPDSPLEIMETSELAQVPGWITTGNYALNWIISKDMFKGLPMGRVSVFSGDPASGKSMVALSMMREPSIDTVILIDTEGGGVSSQFAKFLGIDATKVLYTTCDTIERLIAMIKKIIDNVEKNQIAKNILLVVDSISMLSTDREVNESDKADMGNKAKQTRQFFRTYLRKMQRLNIAAIFTAHLTTNIGGYGPDKVVSGGTILGYAPTLEVRFSQVNAESVTEKSAKGASIQKIRAEIIKSRLGTKAKRVMFDLDMQTGLDPYAGIFDILRDYQIIIPGLADLDKQIEGKDIPKKSSGWWCFKPWVGTGKGEDEKTPVDTVAIHNRLIEEKLATTGKFRESQIGEWAKTIDWVLPEIQKLLDTIYQEVAQKNQEIVEEKVELEKKKSKKVKDVEAESAAIEIKEV